MDSMIYLCIHCKHLRDNDEHDVCDVVDCVCDCEFSEDE